jgi:hypothetical protein
LNIHGCPSFRRLPDCCWFRQIGFIAFAGGESHERQQAERTDRDYFGRSFHSFLLPGFGFLPLLRSSYFIMAEFSNL